MLDFFIYLYYLTIQNLILIYTIMKKSYTNYVIFILLQDFVLYLSY